jgi:hypothetical protein
VTRERFENFAEYIALGDSMSIDLYPALDAGKTDVGVALERLESAGTVAPLGAASLFFRNEDDAWPQEQHNDLSSRFRGIGFRKLATDGATIGDVFGEQIALIDEKEEPTLFTLTIGSEDLFSAFSAAPKPAMLDKIVSDLGEALEFLLTGIRNARPQSLLIATTVCDPSDRTGSIPGVLDRVGPLPIRGIEKFNARLRELASGLPDVVVADPGLEFIGHGVTAEEKDRWFWRRSPLELNARGAHELRRLWLEALREAMAR